VGKSLQIGPDESTLCHAAAAAAGENTHARRRRSQSPVDTSAIFVVFDPLQVRSSADSRSGDLVLVDNIFIYNFISPSYMVAQHT